MTEVEELVQRLGEAYLNCRHGYQRTSLAEQRLKELAERGYLSYEFSVLQDVFGTRSRRTVEHLWAGHADSRG